MPHALLLSPDDQAVTAITGVLEEMSVTCERPLDGVSAAQKLNSASFDLVLVDCENLPAAKLIFDVCRRGKNGNNPVPIAIVDGRAGLPTAFRLGAELILTKPVAKDQARGTIRTAVGRVRKNVPTSEGAAAQSPSAAVTGSTSTEECARTAAAGACSSQLTNFAEPVSSFVPNSLPGAASAAASSATLSAAAVTTKMNSAVHEIDAPPANPELKPQSASFSASPRPLTPSDDPVLAELERTELEESERAESQLVESQKQSSDKPAPDLPAAKSATPLPHRQGAQKTGGSLVALLMLAIAGGGFYFAWTYQPGFRTIVQPQIDRVLVLVGMAPTQEPSPARPSTQLAPAKAPASAADPNQSPSSAPDSATSSAGGSPTGVTTTSAAATAPVQAPVASGKAVAPPATGTATTPVSITPVSGKPEIGKTEAGKSSGSKPSDIGPSDSTKDAAATSSNATPSNAPLPGENSAVILSSKGAENRLTHSVVPKYPAEARTGGAEATVVLKAVVDENGKVEGVRLVEGNATLATAAIEAVKQWRYRPFVRDGKAQAFQTVVIVDFQRP